MSEAIQRADEPVRKGGIGAGRIAFLDGFRGIAILPVTGFHYFTRYAADPRHIVPYSDALAGVRINEYGFYGVMLFFAVSGFVIAITLDHTHNFLEFVVRRFARLWPTMLVCSIITFLVLLIWPLFWQRFATDFLVSKAPEFSGTPSAAIALAVASVMIALAYAIYVVWEHPVNRWMVRRYKQWASKVGLLPARKAEAS